MQALVLGVESNHRAAIVAALVELGVVTYVGRPDYSTALPLFEKMGPDLVVTETDGDGLRLVRAVRRRDPKASIIVVGAGDQWRRSLEAGADRCVEHDPDLRELREVVAAILARIADASDDPLRVIGRLSAAVAYDFNQYVNALGHTLAMLERTPADQALWVQARATIDQAHRLSKLLAVHSRAIPPEHAAIDFAQLVRDCVELARRLLSDQIAITVEIPDRVQPVSGVAAELEQLVLNLVLDAGTSMPSGGALRVRITQLALPVLVLDIDDSGVPRQRASLARGLVHAVALRHSAAIRVTLKIPRGTSVQVCLPQAG